MRKFEHSSVTRTEQSLLLVGQNSHGHWVVRDPSGRRGGFFVSRAEALKFAMFENGHRPQAVIMVPETLDLDFDHSDAPARNAPLGTARLFRRKAA